MPPSYRSIAACAGFFWAAGALGAGLGGVYQSPLGPLQVEESAGVVRATLAEPGGACDFPRGKVVFEGTQLDDNITGTWRACRLGPECRGEVTGMAMWLVTHGGAVWSGAAHLEAGGCQLPWEGDALTLHRVELATAPPPSAAAPGKPASSASALAASGTPPPRQTPAPVRPRPRDARARAEALAGEAARLLEAASIEAARARFLEAAQTDPDYSEAWVGVGVTYYMRDRYDEALENYKRGLEANPGNRDAYYNMACIYALRGEGDLAMRYLEFALMNGYVDVGTLAHDPDLRALHGRADFAVLARLPGPAPVPPPGPEAPVTPTAPASSASP